MSWTKPRCSDVNWNDCTLVCAASTPARGEVSATGGALSLGAPEPLALLLWLCACGIFVFAVYNRRPHRYNSATALSGERKAGCRGGNDNFALQADMPNFTGQVSVQSAVEVYHA